MNVTIDTPADQLPSVGEACDWGHDPDSGARVVRLTSSPAMSHNIYCEQPYASPDGKRFLVCRKMDLLGPAQLFVADLTSLAMTLIEPCVPADCIAHFSWAQWAYYPMMDGSVRRVSFVTLDREVVFPAGTIAPPPNSWLESVTSDGKWLIGYDRNASTSDDLSKSFVSFALEIATGKRIDLVSGQYNTNPHAQAALDDSHRVLHQLIRPKQTPWVDVGVIDLAGSQRLQLPFGVTSAESTGHMAWVADTGEVACACDWDRANRTHDPRHPEGNLLIARPGETTYRVFPAEGHGFYHVSISKCGRYFVCDDFMDFKSDGFVTGPPGPIRIVIGNLDTGKSRALLKDCQNYGIAGSSRFEPDPYFTADLKHVIYNASPFGGMQVFAAEVPDEFLRSLD